MDEQNIQDIPQTTDRSLAQSPNYWKIATFVLTLLLLIGFGVSYVITQQNPMVSDQNQDTEVSQITNSQMIPTDNPAITNEPTSYSNIHRNTVIGYTIPVPTGWQVKKNDSYDLLFPSECENEVIKAAQEKRGIKCTNIELPQNISARGWGYANNRQESQKVTMSDGFTADRGTFYYDDSEFISWNMSLARTIPTPYEDGGIYVFATVSHNNPSSISLSDVYKIVESIRFGN